MSYDPLITAARREAKLRARTTGASHQAMLEQVAREAGASDWASFMAAPLPLAPSPTAGLPPLRDPAVFGSHHVRKLAAVAVTLAVAAAVMVGHHLIEINSAHGFRSQQERNTAPKTVLSGMPGFLGDRGYPYYTARSPDGTLETTVVFLDVRTTPFDPARLHARVMASFTTGRTREEWTYLSHGLSRSVFATDCDDGTIRLRRREIADWYVGPADVSHPTPTAKPIRLSRTAMRSLCGRSALDASARIAAESAPTAF